MIRPRVAALMLLGTVALSTSACSGDAGSKPADGAKVTTPTTTSPPKVYVPGG